MKRIVFSLIKLIFTIALFLLLFRPELFGLSADTFGGVTPKAMWDEIHAAGAIHVIPWLAAAALIKLCGMMAGVLRWRLLLRGQGLTVPYPFLLQSWFVGRAIGIFLPGTIGLDGYRFYDSSRYTGDVIRCGTVIAVEKLTGLVALTGLVFLTFPLGFRLLNFNIPILTITLAILGLFVAGFFLLLLNPRVIQILVAIIPALGPARSILNKLGAAASAYSGRRLELLLAVLLGILVHASTCVMFFCAMMAIRATNTSFTDILFASPLMIYATVIGPSIGGEGIREIVFVTLLGGKSGAATAATFAHLGWWVGDVVPFLIGLVVFLTRTRVSKEQITASLAAARDQAGAPMGLHLTPEQIRSYRGRIFETAGAGLLAGLIAGALIALAESAWLLHGGAHGLNELTLLWWGPLVYGVLFAGVGLGVAGALILFYLLVDRFTAASTSFAISLGGAIGTGAAIIGRFRFQRDVLHDHALTLAQNGSVLGAALGIAVAVALFAGIMLWALHLNRKTGIFAGTGIYFLLVAIGVLLSIMMVPAPATPPTFAPTEKATGPNILLICIDALRADYLPAFNAKIETKTPQIDAFRKDALLFAKTFAQSSWTRPGFGTIFTGLYPTTHSATTKTSMIPDSVTTLAEVLRDSGYYTKGFANNPHIMSLWGFNQGFIDYVDLKPSKYYFGATPSSSKLALYNVLRLVWQRVYARFSNKMVVTEFYQPAETVTQDALAWLDDTQIRQEAPFYLFMHYMDPHDPFMAALKPGQPVDAPRTGYARVRMENPPAAMRDKLRRAYLDEIEYLDGQLGVLFDGLKQRGLYENTLIIFVSDHGEEFYEHQGWWHGQTLYDEVTHIPLLIKLPGGARAGETNGFLARQVDLAPTCLYFAGATQPAAMTGHSLIANGNADGNTDAAYIYSELDFDGNQIDAVRTYDAKRMDANANNPRHTPEKGFFDLEKDPGELQNLMGSDHPRKADEDALSTLLTDMRKAVRENAAEPVINAASPSDVQAQMEAIGYGGQ